MSLNHYKLCSLIILSQITSAYFSAMTNTAFEVNVDETSNAYDIAFM
jgi:hypothetical protein